MSENTFKRKEHWENIYSSKKMEEVSWYQVRPEVSLDLFQKYEIPKEARILDVGGGDSYMVDNLLDIGYTNITVLDISEKAIERAKNRLGNRAGEITWVVSDILDFKPTVVFDVWHDRAAFHFLTSSNEIDKYKDLVAKNVQSNGYVFMGTFSTEGPTKCSGIEIQQYSETSLPNIFSENLTKLECFKNSHHTPFGTVQDFLFCAFLKK